MARVTLSDGDRSRVNQAVAAAEAMTAGEIFTVVAAASDDYRFIPLLWATLIALAVPLPLFFVEVPAEWFQPAVESWENALGGLVTRLPTRWIYVAQLAVFVVAAGLLSLPSIRPRVVPASVRRGRANGLAVQQFLAHGLANTEARTGVLIFVSIAERHAEIIADEGIAEKVDGQVWQAAMDELIAEIRAGRLADGLVAAIEATGNVLAQHFPRHAHDRNEIPDDLVLL